MDDFLPSYESVIRQSPWELIAPYLSSTELCSAALVCHRWHSIFAPQLWGSPASHFGVENDTVYVALTRFKRTLFFARQQVRGMTHTLHLPPAHAELYGGPHYDWLRDCFERLPNLQSLVVDGLPFFDHASLQTLRNPSLWRQSHNPTSVPTFGLRLLDAAGCTNATSTGLEIALAHCPALVYLNLSRTSAAKNEAVLKSLSSLRNLRVLKVAGLGLRDADFNHIASAIADRVRSIDVSENYLTDTSARLLLEYCIRDPQSAARTAQRRRSRFDEEPEFEDEDIFGTADLESHIRKKLTQSFIGSLAVENAPHAGITELNLSRNTFTAEGVSALLRSKQLQVLNIGTLPVALGLSQSTSPDQKGDLILPGVEKLTPVLAECASQSLKYLRIGYEVVTKDAPVEPLCSPPIELPGDGILETSPDLVELEVFAAPRHELDSTGTAVHELPADAQPAELPAVSLHDAQQRDRGATPDNAGEQTPLTETPHIKVTQEPPGINRGPAYAPEPVPTEMLNQGTISPLDATGGLSPLSPISPMNGSSVGDTSDASYTARSRRHSSASFVEELKGRLDLRQSQEPRLHPGMLSKMHTLVLTDVPSRTTDKGVVQRLIQFIRDCAEETTIAALKAKHTYILPPGRSRPVAEREYAQSLFALRRIVLEVAPPRTERKEVSSSWRQYPTLSSTEDADSEMFWEAATHDFSFFGDEECGLPDGGLGTHFPTAAMDGLMLADEIDAPAPKKHNVETPVVPMVDVIAEIAKFRKERKAAYLDMVQQSAEGAVDPTVEGYWPGDVTVIRQPANPGGERVDYYGNTYESGWLYR